MSKLPASGKKEWTEEEIEAAKKKEQLEILRMNRGVPIKTKQRMLSLDSTITNTAAGDGKPQSLADQIAVDHKLSEKATPVLLVNPKDHEECVRLHFKKHKHRQPTESFMACCMALFKLVVRRSAITDCTFEKSGKINVQALFREMERLGCGLHEKTLYKVVKFLQTEDYDMTLQLIDDLKDEIKANLNELAVMHDQLQAHTETAETRTEMGIRSLVIARIGVNVLVCAGRSRSELPAQADLSADEKVGLNLLSQMAADTKCADPLIDLVKTLVQSNRTTASDRPPLRVLSAHSALAAVLLLPKDSLAGLLAQLQYAYLIRPLDSPRTEYLYCDTVVKLADKVMQIDPVTTTKHRNKFEGQLMPACQFRFACQFTAASALAALIATGDSTNPERDYKKLKELTNAAASLEVIIEGESFPEHEDNYLLLKAEQLAVGAELIKCKSAQDEAILFWKKLGKENSSRLLSDISEAERFSDLTGVVEQSIQKAFATVVVTGEGEE